MASDKQNRNNTSRRTYLKLTGAIAGTAAVMGSASASSSKSKYEDEYDTVIDITDVGADNTGDESVSSVIQEHVGDDTLLYFPEGRYYMDDQVRFTGFNNFGVVGDNATLVPANYHDFDDGGDWNYRLFRLGVEHAPGTKLRFEGFTVDQTADETGIRVIEAAIDDGLMVRDIDIKGKHDSGTWGPARVVITDPDGDGLVERFRIPDGATSTSESPADRLWRGPTGILCNDYNKGTMTFRDCVINSFPDTGLYASNGSGAIRIEGGSYKNNMTTNVRLGGNNSYIKDSKIITTEKHWSGRGQNGLRMEKGNLIVADNVEFYTSADESPPVWVARNSQYNYVVNSTITVDTDGPSAGVMVRNSGGQTEFRDTKITHKTGGGPAMRIQAGDEPVNVENVDITSDAATEGTRSAIQNFRDDCEFRSVNIDARGESGRRALTIDADNCLIYKGTYVAESHPLEINGDGTWIEDVTARSREGDVGLLVAGDSNDTYVKKSSIDNGVDDRSSDGYNGWGNEF